jgi:hypothetical protein
MFFWNYVSEEINGSTTFVFSTEVAKLMLFWNCVSFENVLARAPGYTCKLYYIAVVL